MCYSARMDIHDIQLYTKQKTELKKLGVVLLYLHGSVAAGTAREDSDVDIAVLFENKPDDSVGATTAIMQIFRGTIPEHKLDIAILNEASPLLKQIVASAGKLLYERSQGDSLEFELRAMHDYEYSKHVVKLGTDLILNRVSI